MTRQEIIDSLQTCRNAKCFDCQFYNKESEDGYPECMENLLDSITPHIINELQQVDKAIQYLDSLVKREPEMLWLVMLRDNIANLLKGDDSHASPITP